ncbi:MAG: response regulator, partial [bacterium]|nr:response regulator [bacterium]
MTKEAKLLLVDTETEYLQNLIPDLQRAGFKVDTALSAQQAEEKIRFEQPDVVITELMLEKHDSGLLLAKTIKADPLLNNIKVIMLTNVKQRTGMTFSQQENGYWMKTDDYIDKPIGNNEL